ncbi:28S ribosomal protein S30, mitochondrial-like [Mercenaria mercenaria]|uniref:28S ribosomal protein S30, mitochondrial-like n=1 Tax=Mercenaria mercenaria TaxID=6596 RepID=UPI00234FAA62|nr:28S ribosomal protein S30, mitochondrial-like [Mercenaria mercenaria]
MAASMFRSSNFSKCVGFIQLRHTRHLQSIAVQEQNDEDAHYPPIKPKFPTGVWGKMDRKIAWHWDAKREKVAALSTAKDKINHLTENTFSIWKYNCVDTTPNLLDYQCKVTKTRIINGSLPVLYNDLGTEDGFDKEYEKFKQIVVDMLIQEHELNRYRLEKKITIRDSHTPGPSRYTRDYQHSNSIVRGMLVNLLGILSGQRKDVFEGHVDNNVKVSACWSRDGYQRRKPRMMPNNKNYILQNNTMFYGEHIVEYQIRKSLPLPQFVPISDHLCHDLSYSDMPDYKPTVLGQFREKVPRRITAGFNIGDAQQFSHLSIIFLNNRAMARMSLYGNKEKEQADKGYAMGTGFLSTVAQAHVQGFNEYEELTYPFTAQTILTDGRQFILSAYQLNTLQLWKDDTANSLQNLCWIGENEELYEKYAGGKIVGFNDEVFERLLKFFLIKPCDRNGIDLSPNLKEPLAEVDIPDRKEFVTIEEEFQYDRS